MSRLIDADLLGLTDMEIIMCDGDYKEALKMLIDKIEHAPIIKPEQQWIPCSERPPEEVGLYLVTLDYKEYGKCVTALWYHGKQVGWDLRVADVVTAWMPKPKPWKGEENE